jgi:hypothetical protein
LRGCFNPMEELFHLNPELTSGGGGNGPFPAGIGGLVANTLFLRNLVMSGPLRYQERYQKRFSVPDTGPSFTLSRLSKVFGVSCR